MKYRYFAAACGVLASTLGLTVIIGWHIRNSLLLQVDPSRVPMQYNTALGFVLCGLGLIAGLKLRRLPVIVCGAIISFLALATLIQYVFQIDLHIDQILFEPYVTIQTNPPGRMASNTALCFLLTGVGLIVAGLARPRVLSSLAAYLGCLIIAIGGVSLVGYLIDLEYAYGWGDTTRMAIHTSVGFMIVGFGLLQVSAHRAVRVSTPFILWRPGLVGMAVLGATILFCKALYNEEHRLIQNTIAQVATELRNELHTHMSTRNLALKRMAYRWSQAGGTPESVWREDAQAYLEDFPGYQAIEWVDHTFHVRWIEPMEGNESVQGLNLAFEPQRRKSLELAKHSREITITRPLDLVQGGKGFLVYVPIYTDQEFMGFILGVYRIDLLMDTILDPGLVAPGYAIQILDQDQLIYERGAKSQNLEDRHWWGHSELNLNMATWEIFVIPRQSTLAAMRSSMLSALLAGGISLTVLLTMTIHLMQTARKRSTDLELMNQQLTAEATQRHKAELRFRTLIQASPNGVLLVNQNGMIALANEQIEKVFGYSQDDLIGESINLLVPERFRDNHTGMMRQYMAAPQVRPLGHGRDLIGLRRDGSEFPVEIGLNPIHTPEGLVVLATLIDITDRKQAQLALQESERFAHSTIDALRGHLAILDQDGIILAVNKAWRQFGPGDGPTPGHPPGVNYLRACDQVQDDESPCVKKLVEGVSSVIAGQVDEFTEEYPWHRSGQQSWFMVRASRFHGDGPVRVVMVHDDITELKLAELAVRKSEERFNLAVNGSQDGLWDWLDVNKDEEWWSPRFYELLGYTQDEIAPRLSTFVDLLHPEDRDRTQDAVRAHLEENQPFDIEYRLRHKTGHDHWFRARGVAIRNEHGVPQRMAGSIQDIQERKLAQQVIEAKNKDLETLLYVTSHDLREPLRAIQNFSNMIYTRYADHLEDKARDFLRRVVRGAQRMDRLIEDILVLSRAQRSEVMLAPVGPKAIVAEVLERLGTRIQETNAKINIDDDLPVLYVDRRWVTQAVYNLIANALKFTLPDQDPEIDIQPYHRRVEGKDQAGIIVADRGPGVELEQRQRIFTLFQRAVGREVEGTGAGLAIVRQIAIRHDGDAWVQPREGGGSQFILSFPIPDPPYA